MLDGQHGEDVGRGVQPPRTCLLFFYFFFFILDLLLAKGQAYTLDFEI